MIWLRIAGCVLVTASCGALGILKARQWRSHRQMLERLRRMVYLLRGEILYAMSPLQEALERVGGKSDDPAAVWFCRVAERLKCQEGETFSRIWREELDRQAKAMLLSPGEVTELAEFGEHLGYLDVGMQERTIALYLEQLDLSIGFLREHEQERTRMCACLGIMGGLFLSVLLC